MLLRFGVSNHLSIRDPQELSLVASSLKDRDDALIGCAASPSGSVLPAVAIYGPNASGKSNLVDAIRAMRQMVLRSHAQGEPGGGVPLRQHFRLDSASVEKPSRFDMDFVVGGVRHHYGFEASGTAFEAEWLYDYPAARRRMLFERRSGDYRFGRALKGRNRVIADLTRPNSLFLSAAAQNGHRQLSGVFEFFSSINGVSSGTVSGTRVSALLSDDALDSRVIEFLGKIGTGVLDYRRTEVERSDEDKQQIRRLAEIVGVGVPEDKETRIELAHRGAGGERIYFELDRESAGTRCLLVMLHYTYDALDKGTPLIVDELDASLHTHAADAVLRLFCSPATNPYGAQLVATTHDTNLLRSPVLRRDEVWFAEKDAEGATAIYPLTDIRTRKGDNLEKGYLQGRYGASYPADLVSDVADARGL